LIKSSNVHYARPTPTEFLGKGSKVGPARIPVRVIKVRRSCLHRCQMTETRGMCPSYGVTGDVWRNDDPTFEGTHRKSSAKRGARRNIMGRTVRFQPPIG